VFVFGPARLYCTTRYIRTSFLRELLRSRFASHRGEEASRLVFVHIKQGVSGFHFAQSPQEWLGLLLCRTYRKHKDLPSCYPYPATSRFRLYHRVKNQRHPVCCRKGKSTVRHSRSHV
jgi:hypothetical protein